MKLPNKSGNISQAGVLTSYRLNALTLWAEYFLAHEIIGADLVAGGSIEDVEA